MNEIIPDIGFRAMSFVMKAMEWVHPRALSRAKTFGIKEGMTVVDYGCGPGMYTAALSKLAGKRGKVIAVDLSRLAKEYIDRKVRMKGLQNVQFCLAHGYESGVETGIADIVVALDMFFMIEKPAVFLKELGRILKPDGTLVMDDGHQSRVMTKKKLKDAGIFKIVEESKDHLKCRRIQ
jgi:ubiquinone/menaquinone biosynthesis C-methylase UbiE